jgi:hypothetical protein
MPSGFFRVHVRCPATSSEHRRGYTHGSELQVSCDSCGPSEARNLSCTALVVIFVRACIPLTATSCKHAMFNTHTIRHTVLFQPCTSWLIAMLTQSCLCFATARYPRYPWMLLPNNRPAPWGANYSLAEEFEGMIDANHPVSCFVSARFFPLVKTEKNERASWRILCPLLFSRSRCSVTTNPS